MEINDPLGQWLNTCLDELTTYFSCLFDETLEWLSELNAYRSEATLSLTQLVWNPIFACPNVTGDGKIGLIPGRADLSIHDNKSQRLQGISSAVDGDFFAETACLLFRFWVRAWWGCQSSGCPTLGKDGPVTPNSANQILSWDFDSYSSNTNSKYKHILFYCAWQILHFFYKLKICGNRDLNKPIGTIFPTGPDDV